MSTAPSRGFSTAEFEHRLAAAQRLMAAAGLDALLLTTEAEVRYFSGFLTQFWQSPTRPWFLLVLQTGKPIAVIPSIGEPLMRRTWLDDIRVWSSPNPDDEGIGLLAETVREKAVRRVGVLMEAETHLRMPLNDYAKLQACLPTVEFTDDSAIMRRLRMRKSPAEVAKIAHICAIAGAAFATVADFAHAGQSLRAVFCAFKKALLTAADDVPYLVGAAGSGGYADVISPPTDEPLCDNDVLMMDTGAVYDGYLCDFDRNFAIGRADDDTRRLYETLYRATDAGRAAAHPGARCADIFAAMAQVIADDGYGVSNVGRFGHGLGMQLTEPPSICPADHTILTPDMVLTLEPSAMITPARGMVHEENIVIREDGAHWLTARAPAELQVVS